MGLDGSRRHDPSRCVGETTDHRVMWHIADDAIRCKIADDVYGTIYGTIRAAEA